MGTPKEAYDYIKDIVVPDIKKRFKLSSCDCNVETVKESDNYCIALLIEKNICSGFIIESGLFFRSKAYLKEITEWYSKNRPGTNYAKGPLKEEGISLSLSSNALESIPVTEEYLNDFHKKSLEALAKVKECNAYIKKTYLEEIIKLLD